MSDEDVSILLEAVNALTGQASTSGSLRKAARSHLSNSSKRQAVVSERTTSGTYCALGNRSRRPPSPAAPPLRRGLRTPSALGVPEATVENASLNPA